MLNSENARLQWDDLRSLAFGGISATYALMSPRFANNPYVIILQNFTDAQITFTDDVTIAAGKWTLPPNGQMVLDISTWGLLTSIGDGIWAKGTPTSGSVYLSVGYGQ